MSTLLISIRISLSTRMGGPWGRCRRPSSISYGRCGISAVSCARSGGTRMGSAWIPLFSRMSENSFIKNIKKKQGKLNPLSRGLYNIQLGHGQGNISFPCSADHEQDWRPYPVDPYSAICDDHTYIHTYIAPWCQYHMISCTLTFFT